MAIACAALLAVYFYCDAGVYAPGGQMDDKGPDISVPYAHVQGGNAAVNDSDAKSMAARLPRLPCGH